MNETRQQTTTDKGAEERRKYMREYRRRNADKVKEWNRTYWQRKAEKAAREKV